MEITAKRIIEYPEYKIYEGKCPHCKAFILSDFEVKAGVRKYRFPCPKCDKEIVLEKDYDNRE